MYLESSIYSIDDNVFNAAIDAICKVDNTYIFGIGPDEHLACHPNFRLRRLKIRSQVIYASGRNLFEYLLLLPQEDLAVVYSFSKPPIEFKRLMAVLSEKKVQVILITDMRTPPVIRSATYVLYAERGPLGTFPSPLGPMAITNALILGIADKLETRAIDALKELGDLRDNYYYTEKFNR